MSRKAPDFPIAPILEYLGFENVPRVTSGYRKVICAFHGESNPSASVGRYSFRCFGCQVSGDAISLLRTQEHLSFTEAVTKCEELTGGGHAAGTPRHNDGWGGSLLDP